MLYKTVVTEKTEELLNLLLWTATKTLQPTFRNLSESYEGWAYRNGLLRQSQRLERSGYLERKIRRRGDRLYRLTSAGRLHALGGCDPETQWNREWDGRWRLLIFDIPLGRNSERARLRNHLLRNRFGCLQRSVWITPDDVHEERRILGDDEINVRSLILVEAKAIAGESNEQIVVGAWNFEKINERYSRCLKVLNQRPGRAAAGEATPQALLNWMKKERAIWLEAIWNDPLLPACLLPSSYLGRSVWHRRSRVLAEAGRQMRRFGGRLINSG